MFEDEFDDSVERDGGVFIGRHNHADHDDKGRDIDLGENRDPEYEERDPELWGQQRALIEEDEENSVNLADFPEDVAPRIIDAMGDDVAEPLQDSPNGVSATGSTSEPEHGGFPERE